jgi:DNA-binding LacI/PurR family transcriptional regulator
MFGLGHTRIGFMGDRVDEAFHFRSSRDRHNGYLSGLAVAGLGERTGYHAEGEHSRQEARRLATGMLKLGS